MISLKQYVQQHYEEPFCLTSLLQCSRLDTYEDISLCQTSRIMSHVQLMQLQLVL